MDARIAGWCTVLVAGLALGCLDASVLNNKLCDDDGLCADGYHCDADTRRCLTGFSSPDPGSSAEIDRGAASDAEGAGGLGPDDTGDPTQVTTGDGSGPGDAGDPTGNPAEPPAPIVAISFDADPHPPVASDEAPAGPNVVLHPTDRKPLGLTYADGAVCFSGGRLAANASASQKLSEALLASGSFTVVFWAQSSNLDQSGVLLTLSSGLSTRSFTLSQKKKALLVRLRTAITDANGTTYPLEVEGFSATSRVTQIAFSYAGPTGAASLFLDGELQIRQIHRTSEQQPAALGWSADREIFGLGNEIGAERPWSGCLHQVAVYDQALGAGQIRSLFQQGN